MPELPLSQESRKQTIFSAGELSGINTKIRKGDITREEISKYVIDHGFSLVGYGYNWLVVKGKDEKIYSFYMYPSEFSKHVGRRIFYTHKICSQLFPDNIPKVNAALFPTHKDMPLALVREEVVKTTENLPLPKTPSVEKSIFGGLSRKVKALQKGVVHPFTSVLIDCKKYGLPFDFDLANQGNFIISGTNEYYIDEIEIKTTTITEKQEERILQYAQERNISIDNIKNEIQKLNEVLRE